ncbi:MAG TPA: FlgD immunoglobulin-like domain containing protein, partial [bacterium]|nr:FlgD immunoglobulin-like domain containing protein [bacterium]
IAVSAPDISIYDYSVDDSAGGNGNGCIEAGETVTVTVDFWNGGGDDATDASIAMTATDPFVTITSGTFGTVTIGAGDTMLDPAVFELTVAPDTPGFHEFMLDFHVTTPSGYSTMDDFGLLVGASTMTEDFEASGANWVHGNVTSGFVDQWHVETYRSYSATSSWKFGGAGSAVYANSADGALETPSICVGAEAEMSFWSWLDAEEESSTSAWDGALIEITTDDGGTWSNLAPVGGYSHAANNNPDNPLPTGTPCWSGTHTWREETFDLSAYEGQRVAFRFRFASDGYVQEEGWYIDDVSVTSTGTGVDGSDTIPREFALRQNAPNPFNPVTTIAYSLPEAAHVAIRVYSVAGKLVATLRDGEEQAGSRSVVWDGTNDRGQSVGSGVYFCSMTAGEFTASRTMVLLK